MQSILDTVSSYAAQASEDSRRLLASALRDMAVSIETPSDTVQRILYQPFEIMAAQVACDLNLFQHLAATNKPQSTEALATELKVDPVLMSRILRYLASFRYIQETSENHYQATHVTRTLANPAHQSGIWFHLYFYLPIILKTPGFLKDTGYTNPSNPVHTPLQKAFDTQLPGFLWLQENPDYLQNFLSFLGGYHGTKAPWTSVVPVREECTKRNPDSVLFVDIGGAIGSQCVVFQHATSGIPGRIINQDLQQTIDVIPALDGIEKMAHDFFTPQPMKGAKYYFLRNILHDYPDAQAIRILRNLLPAMAAGSVVLINELIVPDVAAHGFAAQQDLAMLMTLGAMERTETQWRALVDAAGFEVRSMVTYVLLSGDAVIEIVPKVVLNGH